MLISYCILPGHSGWEKDSLYRLCTISEKYTCNMKNAKEDGGFMGKSDIAIKKWLGNKERFADLFNGVVFQGS